MTDDKEMKNIEPENDPTEVKKEAETEEEAAVKSEATESREETPKAKEEAEPKKEDKVKKGLLARLASLKLAVVIFVYLMVVCIIATLLPQNQTAEFYSQSYGALGNMITAIKLDTIFSSFWIIIGGGALGVNLLACTWRRLKWSRGKNSAAERPRFDIQGEEEVFDGTLEEAEAAYGKKFEKFSPKRQINEKGQVAWTAQKGRIACWGSPILHFGLCVVLLGTLLSLLMGQTSFEVIPIGQEKEINVGPKPYTLRVEDFNIEYYENSETPKQYSSELTAIYREKETSLYSEVNHPAKFNGTQILQSSYNWNLNMSVGDGETVKDFSLADGDEYWLNEEQHLSLMVRFYPDYALDEQGYIMNASNDPNNPVLLCMLFHSGEPIAADSLSPGEEKELAEGISLGFKDFNYSTGLQIKYDPGVNIIFIGFIIICLGMALRFLIPGRVLRVVFTPKEEGVEVVWQKTSII
ncbi:MAG: cytochrome c biogenesis protein ResB [Bacillota bacterium]|nr:cytochrome c biogenesis protein ResB [Bacillota bacterium]